MPYTDFYADGHFVHRAEGLLDAHWPPDSGERSYTVVHVVTVDDIRAEAGRRIYARYPLHVQLNMQARAAELLLIGPANWTFSESDEAAALQAARDWIKSVRAASNALEAEPPADFHHDERWPT